MKTIDEVIKAVHHCGLLTGFDDTYEYDGGCPYEDCSECEKKRVLGKDIIQYLAAYKDEKNDLTALRAFWKEQHDNHPLDWDDLRKMEGKPVWVEWSEVIIGDYFQFHGWFLVEWINDNENEIIMQNKYGKRMIRHKNDNDWQAYKKERK